MAWASHGLESVQLVEFDCVPGLGEQRERPAGVDGAELVRVPDEHDLGAGRGGLCGERVQVGGGDHRGFVDQE